ncbi:MAG TPA: nuclear transport factor 2 family protein [Gammaproteobacteria bacterium]
MTTIRMNVRAAADAMAGAGRLIGARSLGILLAVVAAPALAQDPPWAEDPAVQEVLAMRRLGIDAMTSGRVSAETERYSSTFVANTPSNRVVHGDELLALFESGGLRYESVEQRIEYAGSHGPDIVVLMGEEIVVPGEGMPDAGRRVRRRFTDVFRRENGEWRHDLRHSHVVAVE